jgi:drug/metabolite transporter (DMT)-like permease
MIRIAQNEGVASLSIAVWRLGLAAAVLSVLVVSRAATRVELGALRAGDWGLAAVSGMFLAAHFACWILSLSYTSIASSAALVATNPIWIALASWLIFRERPGVWLTVGIAAAIGGSVLIFLADARVPVGGANSLLGNILAMLGSLTVCGYLLLGRKLRRTFSLLAYIWIVYSTAAIALVLAAIIAGAALIGFNALAWLCLIALAIGPQLLGHSAFNWALKHVSATFIAVATLAEPIGSALLGWIVFGERFSPLQLAGFVLLLAGIYLASRDGGKGAAAG